VSEYYKTGYITVTKDGLIRIYVNEHDTCGYFFSSDGADTVFIEREAQHSSMLKNACEPTMCTIDDVMKAIRTTYAKEIR
jgi:hypothetical protein